MTDFRALCQELMDEAIYLGSLPYEQDPDSDLIARASTALAQPEPQGPTDEELYDYWISTSPEFGCADPVGFARAALARWGRPAIEPVPKQEDIHYTWDLFDAEGERQVGGYAYKLDDVKREGNRYLQIYSQDGPHELIIEQHCVIAIEPVPKREAEQ